MKKHCLADWRLAAIVAAVMVTGALTAPSQIKAQKLAAQQEVGQPTSKSELEAVARQYFPSDEAAVPAKRIFRLTRDQIDASVASLLPKYYSRSIKTAMAKDSLQTNYEFAELLSLNPANIGLLSGWIAEIAQRVRKDPSGVIDCAAGSSAEACLRSEARAFISKAFRGDVSEEKLEQITQFYLAGVRSVGLNQATAELVEVVLNSPGFLFRKETDIGRNGRLAPAQLLQSVTYTIADAPPEKLDLNSSLAGQYLKSGNEAAATISAIVASKDSREKIVRFFKAWLEIKEPGEFTISEQVFPEFKPELAAAMLEESDRFLRAQLGKPAPKLKDITQSTQSYVSKALEGIYATRATDLNGGKPVNLDPAQRLGIFSQPAVLASHSGPDGTRPIKRGVFWARKVMCMDLEPPPKDLHAELYDLEGVTERQRIEQSTRGAACVGCHKIINPFGFFQESYDVLGRWRTVDKGHPIDTSILIDFLDEKPKTAASAVDALKTFTGSLMFKQCFVRQMFRFYMGRQEEAADDPLLRRMFLELARNDDQDIFSMVYLLSSSDRIVRRQ